MPLFVALNTETYEYIVEFPDIITKFTEPGNGVRISEDEKDEFLENENWNQVDQLYIDVAEIDFLVKITKRKRESIDISKKISSVFLNNLKINASPTLETIKPYEFEIDKIINMSDAEAKLELFDIKNETIKQAKDYIKRQTHPESVFTNEIAVEPLPLEKVEKEILKKAKSSKKYNIENKITGDKTFDKKSVQTTINQLKKEFLKV